MSYGLSFAAISSLIVYTWLHNRKQIWQQYRNSTTEKPDIHMKLMQKYKEAPTWWYMSLFGVVSIGALPFFAPPSFNSSSHQILSFGPFHLDCN